MKKIILLLLVGITANLNAQTLFGTAVTGGDSAGGVLFSFDVLTGQYKVQQSFPIPPANGPLSTLMQATDGNIYGMTPSGGIYDNGEIFRITTTGSYEILASFNSATGQQPKGKLTEGYDGNLYGTTSQGGQKGYGTLFRFNLSNDSIYPVVSFDYTTSGQYPGNLLAAKDSNLYGTSRTGSSGGTLFRYSIKKDTLIVITPNAGSPLPDIIQGYDGNIYGVNNGGIFRSSTSGSLFDIASFTTADGNNPCGIIQAADSSFYGMTNSGGANGDGTIFKYNPISGITVLYNFTSSTGNQANSILVQGTDGFLYGMTPAAGGQGNVFKCSTTGTFTNLAYFSGLNGDWPDGALIQATDGNLYGMTNAGGAAYNQGVLFRCTTSGTLTTLENFGTNVYGNWPFGGVIQGKDGNIYGTTAYGGANGGGTVFKWTLSDTLTSQSSLNNNTGYMPFNNMLQASDGNFYGVTIKGGTNNAGTIFRYNPVTMVTDTLINFYNWGGSLPEANLIQASDGNLYGTTYYGGAGYGILYRVSLTGVFTTLYSFGGGDQAYPDGGLVQAKDGNIYGTTSGASGFHGTIFQYVISTGTLNGMHIFSGPDGEMPECNLIQGFDGSLYGTTHAGGTSGSGTIFKCTTTGTFTSIFSFDGVTNGVFPEGIMQGADSNLYGMTQGGTGSFPNSTIYKCSPSGSLTNLITLNNAEGNEPNFVTLIEVQGVKINVTSPGCTAQVLTAVPVWNGKAPYSYVWSTGATTSSISGITTAGTYTVAVTDANGISYSGSVSLPAYMTMSQSAMSIGEICHGDSNGSAKIIVNGGTPPYTYSWSDGRTTSSISNIIAGTYSVTVTDRLGCAVDTTINVVQPATMLNVVLTATNVKCSSLSDGSVSAGVTGGISPYTYAWNTGAITTSINNLPAGHYCVTVTDSNGCRVTECDSVNQPPNTLDSVRVCMVSVDTASLHNILVWNKNGLNNIDSLKVYYLNSSSSWQLITELPFSATQYTDTLSINNPNSNTVRYCVTGVDSCGNEEAITLSPWQNTMYINNSPPGTFIWAGTGYLIQNVSLPVITYYLYRDSINNGDWQAIDSVSGTQNKMTDPNYSKYPLGKWYVDAKLNIDGCPIPIGRARKAPSYVSSRSNAIRNGAVGIAEVQNNSVIDLYPNPASGMLNIKFSTIKESNAHIIITDVTGRIVSETNGNITTDGNMAINVAAFPAGVYFVKIATGNSFWSAKFVKE